MAKFVNRHRKPAAKNMTAIWRLSGKINTFPSHLYFSNYSTAKFLLLQNTFIFFIEIIMSGISS